jgi:uncharacterized Rossmann fold enzyme
MEYKDWEPNYLQILRDFKFRREDDERSAALLSELLDKHKSDNEKVDHDYLKGLLKDKATFIFGEGPNLNRELDDFDYEGTIISADGATSALMKINIVPDIIVTDLDGKIEDQIEAVKRGAVVLIHAHGDNLEQLKKWVPKFKGKVIGTTQAKPVGNLSNFGGFTDGDRAAFLADHFKARKINLVAFDFTEVGDYKNKEAMRLKLRKLTWADLLIGVLNNPKIYFYPPKAKAPKK